MDRRRKEMKVKEEKNELKGEEKIFQIYVQYTMLLPVVHPEVF